MNTVAMERPKQATVTIQFVNPAKQQGKPASIKDTDGQFFSVWPDKLAQFQPGETYDIEYTEKVVNGVVYRNVKNAAPSGSMSPAPSNFITREEIEAQRQSPRQATQTVPQNIRGEFSAPIVTKPQGQPAATANQFYRPTAPQDARRMFWTATLGHFIETGRVNCTAQDIADKSTEILAAYDAVIRAETAE